MSGKTMVWVGVFVGSILGGWLPSLFGASVFSIWGIVGSFIGAFAGIWFVVKYVGI